MCSKIGSGSTPSGGRSVYVSNGVKFIRSQNVYNKGLFLDEVAHITQEIHSKKSVSTVQANDLLLNITGASIGRCAIVPSDFDTANINQHILILRLINLGVRFFVHIAIIAPYTFETIMSQQVGATKEGLSAEKAKRLLIPLPPLVEQQRIVSKIHELVQLYTKL